MKNPLTPQHKQQLNSACSQLDEARGLCKRCNSCGIDTTDLDSVIDDLDSKAKALLQHFFPPLGDQTQLGNY